MKLYITSDLHLGAVNNGDEASALLAEYTCANSGPRDALVLIGDIGTHARNFELALRMFKPFRGPKMLVCGNHDIWVEDGIQNSIQKYKLLEVIAARHNFIFLEEHPTTHMDAIFIGLMGWYDYSFRDDIGVPRECYADKLYAGNQWNDRLYAHWRRSDPQVTDWQVRRLKSQLGQSIGQDKRIFVFTHHVPIKKLLKHPRCLVPKKWRFLNAFLGSEEIGKAISRYANFVEHVFVGHIHMSKEVSEGSVRYSSIGSCYNQKELVVYANGRIERHIFSSK
ncbi:MAG: hypothetical protein GF349_04945 [Candidatus Magasanikbacteria bacterium]|nr:hypothetical protein [Candidatus Magasanikbacteria bacterium]